MTVDISSVTAMGVSDDVGVRPTMEDAYIFIDRFCGKSSSAFFAVYDGHGGDSVVNFIVKDLHVRLASTLADPSSGLVSKALIDAFVRSDAAAFRAGDSRFGGCTATVCLLHAEGNGKRLYVAHVGDSRAVLCRGGAAVRLTSESDHKASDINEKNRVMLSGGFVMNDRVNGMLAVSRAIGDHQLKSSTVAVAASTGQSTKASDVVSCIPDVTVTDIAEGIDNFIILACDGIWDVLDDQEAVNIVLEAAAALTSVYAPKVRGHLTQGALANLLSRCLVEEALSRGTQDNVTCMIVLL